MRRAVFWAWLSRLVAGVFHERRHQQRTRIEHFGAGQRSVSTAAKMTAPLAGTGHIPLLLFCSQSVCLLLLSLLAEGTELIDGRLLCFSDFNQRELGNPLCGHFIHLTATS